MKNPIKIPSNIFSLLESRKKAMQELQKISEASTAIEKALRVDGVSFCPVYDLAPLKNSGSIIAQVDAELWLKTIELTGAYDAMDKSERHALQNWLFGRTPLDYSRENVEAVLSTAPLESEQEIKLQGLVNTFGKLAKGSQYIVGERFELHKRYVFQNALGIERNAISLETADIINSLGRSMDWLMKNKSRPLVNAIDESLEVSGIFANHWCTVHIQQGSKRNLELEIKDSSLLSLLNSIVANWFKNGKTLRFTKSLARLEAVDHA